ncbi:transcriptional regulator (plasmid) [Skermanella rosea]|uniref:transcriptional regulator n=1 Tax=Skermanella rosea TaxID=1817965 RepID=UPI001932AED9|nr:transcriptional regulator [Skermanella rosea]UEM08234.1 transcriptional regulator [Skermanella rosea]
MITKYQVRMARIALGWGVRDLGQKSGLATGTIARVEAGKESMAGSLRKIRQTLEDAGIDFPDEFTVSCRRMLDRVETEAHP